MKLNKNIAPGNRNKAPRILGALVALAITGGLGAEASASSRPTMTTMQSKPAKTNHDKQTPKQVLSGEIANLYKAGQVEVTVDNVTLPDQVSTAKGRPIVFWDNKQTYFAYTEFIRPTFNVKRPLDVVNEMVIMKEPKSDRGVDLTMAHLGKLGTLVSPDGYMVGFSSAELNTSKTAANQ